MLDAAYARIRKQGKQGLVLLIDNLDCIVFRDLGGGRANQRLEHKSGQSKTGEKGKMSARRPLRVLAVVSRPLAHTFAVKYGGETFEAVSPVSLPAVHIVRDQLRRALAADDIPVQVHFLPWARLTDVQVALADGEANTLLALAPFKENAEEIFRIALSLYETIGDHYSIARGLYYLGRYLHDQNQPDKARAVLRQSLEMFEALDLPSVAATVRQMLDNIG